MVVISVYFAWQRGLLKPANIQNPVSTTDQNIPDRSLVCPLPLSFCQGKDLYKESSLSAKLSTDTPLYAAFDGLAEGFPLTNTGSNGKREDFTLVSLNRKEPPLQALYYLKGKVPERKEVKAGEVITTSNGQPLEFLEGKSFVFVLLKPGEGGGSLRPIAPPNFK
ncbi:MAG: hypothetical protein AABZ57_03850 [Candidatus Margulisiibacteriota bacterium]